MANNALSESFNNGVGAINNAWNVDTSVGGQVTLRGNAGMMEYATGRDAGHGYGTYTITARVDGSQPGPAIVFWPGDNNWPGQEIDMAEITPDGSGRQYGAVHWNNNGSDAANYVIFDGVGGGAFHDYQMVWEPGRITFRVDGATKGSVTDNVPVDYDRGGMNNTIGFLNNNPNTSITVTNVEFSPWGGGGSSGGSSGSGASSGGSSSSGSSSSGSGGASSGGAVDWNALAAEVTANYERTGSWSASPQPSAPAQPPAENGPTPAPSNPAPGGGQGGGGGGSSGGAMDWNALAAEVTANYEKTGSWSAGPQPSAPAQPPTQAPAQPGPSQGSGPVDWNALAAEVTANYEATGGWFA